jgi:hypothetical protein
MSESPSDRVRSDSENILILTGSSIALSTLVFFFACAASSFSYDFAPPVSLITIIYHATILILSRRRRNIDSPDASRYSHAIMRPAIGLAGFLFVAWLITISFMIVGLITFEPSRWYDPTNRLVKLWAQFILAVVETGVMLSIVIQGGRARRNVQLASERQVQI